jgi:hypothetical protein
MKKKLSKNFFKIIVVVIFSLLVAVCCKKDVNVTGVTLDKPNITLAVGESAILTATIHPNDATNKAVSWSSSNSTIATVSNGVVTAKEAGSAVITVITKDDNYTAHCSVTVISVETEENGVVINGVKWATRNVDMPNTFVARSKDAGLFYQWNSNVGWSSSDPLTASDGINIWRDLSENGSIWQSAKNPCPTGWRIPTREECLSLVNSGNIWTTQSGVTGRVFGTAPNTIFLPAADSRNPDDGRMLGYEAGNYWSCSPYSLMVFAYDDEIVGTAGCLGKTQAAPIRCVAE